MRQPLVSVVLPVFDAAPHVEAALTSVCAQDYRRLEIIVIDDGSSDDSLARIERIARRDARIKVRSRPNRGLIATLNEGVALARGDLIARMDADDIAYPARISSQVAAFETAPGLALCATGVDMLQMGRLWRSNQAHEGDLRVLSRFFTVFIHPTVMVDRRVLGDMLHYDSRYPHAEDFDLFRRIAAAAPVRVLKQPLLAYRMHKNRVSIRHQAQQRDSHLRIVAENLRADGFALDVDALPAMAAAADRDAAARVAEMLTELDAQIAARAAPLRASYEAGAVHLLHFLMNALLDAGKAPLVCEMFTHAGKWGAIRRRERAILRTTSQVPPLASALMRQSNHLQMVLELPASRPVGGLMARLREPLREPAGETPGAAFARTDMPG